MMRKTVYVVIAAAKDGRTINATNVVNENGIFHVRGHENRKT